jgi:alkyldihydroxyacetonephosphate synthase
MDQPELGPNAPTPPIALPDPAAVTVRPETPRIEVGDAVITRLEATGATVTTDPAVLAESSRDWWPLAMVWAVGGQVAGLASALARPHDPDQVPEILAVCNEQRIPVTTAAGRSGVCGASVPAFGGLVLDMGGLSGIVGVDDDALTVDVRAGTFGDHFEADLQRDHGLTVGHWPQSMALSTVGGWLACRGAGQYSTRYGKIEDIVVGIDVVLADGRVIATGGQPREAVGPDLNQLFVGSEGTLGVITGARLKAHPVAPHERRGAFGFSSFADGLAACRRILRRGATPAVLRLYDAVEADRNYQTGDDHVLLVLDEGDHALVDATIELVAEECMGGHRLDDQLVESWMGHRNDVSALEKLISRGYVVDTMEIAAPWSKLDAIYDTTLAAIGAVPGTLAVSAHQSHAYLDGACLYFTFAGQPDDGGADPDGAAMAARERYYRDVWDAGTGTVLAGGGALSHHHGVGLNRSRFVADALGGAFDVLAAVKGSLDPNGILNPGKLGLPSPFGEVAWP